MLKLFVLGQRQKVWRLLPTATILATHFRPNSGAMQGYSLLRSQSARFTNIPADAVYAFLQDDERLYAVEDTRQIARFGSNWGDPALDVPYGTLCFGDFELPENHTLLITALSDARMAGIARACTRRSI